MPSILQIHHIDIIIPRGAEAAAREFYCDLLGLQETEKPTSLLKNGGLWLEVAGSQVHLSIQDGYDPRQTKAHIAYLASDLQALRVKLESKGIAISENSPIPGFKRFDVRDPFGNRIEFLERTVEP